MDSLEILQKRDDALKRVRNAWQDIIKRYSSTKLQDEGDIVDLKTGEIINDNGHLRSLTEKSDSIWSNENKQIKKNQIKSIISTKKIPKNINLSTKPIEIIELDKIPSKTISKHLTRSKVAGDDNLILKYKNTVSIENSNHNKNKKTFSFSPRSLILRNSNSNLNNDPMNLLKSIPSLDTPSKVRRLKKAMDKHVKHKPIHSLILRSSNKSASSILKSKSGTNKSKIK